jgi:hypothetical protein
MLTDCPETSVHQLDPGTLRRQNADGQIPAGVVD